MINIFFTTTISYIKYYIYLCLKQNKYIMENQAQAKPKNAKYFEIRIDGFKETLDRLRSIQERLEGLELSLTGTRATESKGELKSSNDSMGAVAKPCIMEELNGVNDRFNTIIYDMQDSIKHLEEIV